MIPIDPDDYRLSHPESVHSPGLLIFRDQLDANLQEMLRIAGSPDRLRPHCKTHKTREIIELQLKLGITRHKCATLREAEMLAACGVEDILIAYQMVGPNLERLVALLNRFPGRKFSTLIDDPRSLEKLSAGLQQHGRTIDVFLDVDSGMGRTGIPVGDEAVELYEMICLEPSVEVRGLHWYDGHHRDSDLQQRRLAVESVWNPLVEFRNRLVMQGFPVPTVVAAGTGSFPILAEQAEPGLELSPGTITYFDRGYWEQFPDMNYRPALAILTRVVSCRRTGFLTLDLGHKSCAADPPAGSRLFFPELPDAVEFGQTEEHLVLQTDRASEFCPGDPLVAIPVHACPTSALHEQAAVIQNGEVVDHWSIAARGRRLHVELIEVPDAS